MSWGARRRVSSGWEGAAAASCFPEWWVVRGSWLGCARGVGAAQPGLTRMRSRSVLLWGTGGKRSQANAEGKVNK